jgi:histone acetyltransferase (RNA polymerase elongator complex component)
MLRVEKEKETLMQEIGIEVETDPNFIDDEEIRKKLAMSAKKIEEWLATVNEDYIRDRIYDVAVEMNLTMNKIKVLQAAMPKKSFMED